MVAATNRDLEAAVAQKQFREDLFFRLSVFPVEVPPLRRRRGDVLLLAEAFLQRYGREMGRKGLKLSDAARRALLDHSWPGNVRELQNCLERAVILCPGAVIEPVHLRIVGGGGTAPSLRDVFAEGGLFASYTSIEREARAAKTGIWAAGEPERPSEFRAKVWEEAKRRAPDGCPIKGQVAGSARTYVLPWSPDYERVRVQRARGERWFCSEPEAAAAGFKARE